MRHQPRVRIRRKTVTADFLPIIVELFFRQAAFKEGAGIHPRCAVTLEENQIAALSAILAMPKVVLPDLIHHGRRRKTGDVTADIRVLAGADDHRQRIPAHESLDALFQREIARIGGLTLGRNRIVIRCSKAAGEAQAIA